MKEKVFVFDLDDTLMPEWRFVASGALIIRDWLTENYPLQDGRDSSAFYENLRKEMLKGVLSGSRHFDVLESVLKKESVGDTDLVRKLVEMHRNHFPNLHLSKDRKKILDELKRIDSPICIITDGRTQTQYNKIKALGLLNYVKRNDIYISEERGHDKLSDCSFKEIQDKYSGRKYYYIGDNAEKDFIVANQLGWTTIKVPWYPYHIHKEKSAKNDKNEAKIKLSRFADLINYI